MNSVISDGRKWKNISWRCASTYKSERIICRQLQADLILVIFELYGCRRLSVLNGVSTQANQEGILVAFRWQSIVDKPGEIPPM